MQRIIKSSRLISLRPNALCITEKYQTGKRWNSTDNRVNTIVDQIAGLTLLETADLVSALKVKKSVLRMLTLLKDKVEH
jgi:hypothetical protein